jgi:hypothetical protein
VRAKRLPHHRGHITERWISTEGLDILIGDRVRSEDGAEGFVEARFTAHKLGELVPCVSGLSHPTEPRFVSRPAAECVHVDGHAEGIPVANVPSTRLTTVWPDATGKDVPVGATVAYDGERWTVKGRFTAHRKAGLIHSSH